MLLKYSLFMTDLLTRTEVRSRLGSQPAHVVVLYLHLQLAQWIESSVLTTWCIRFFHAKSGNHNNLHLLWLLWGLNDPVHAHHLEKGLAPGKTDVISRNSKGSGGLQISGALKSSFRIIKTEKAYFWKDTRTPIKMLVSCFHSIVSCSSHSNF